MTYIYIYIYDIYKDNQKLILQNRRHYFFLKMYYYFFWGGWVGVSPIQNTSSPCFLPFAIQFVLCVFLFFLLIFCFSLFYLYFFHSFILKYSNQNYMPIVVMCLVRTYLKSLFAIWYLIFISKMKKLNTLHSQYIYASCVLFQFFLFIHNVLKGVHSNPLARQNVCEIHTYCW